MTRVQPWWPVVGAIALAPITGTLIVVSPVIGLLSVLVVSVVSVATYYRHRLPRAFLGAVGVCLFGYTFLDKGFAYFGLAPLCRRLLLMFGVLAALLGGGICAGASLAGVALDISVRGLGRLPDRSVHW